MNKNLSALLISGVVLLSNASASNIGIEPNDGPSYNGTTRQLGITDDANSQASYVANTTYIELIEAAASKMLKGEDYNFFMDVSRAFSTNGSGSTHKFRNYDKFRQLHDLVNSCKLPTMTASQEHYFRGNDEQRMSFSLDYALTTVVREAKLADYNMFKGL